MRTPVRLPDGFRASGTTCGIKASGRPDLALFVSDRPAAAAGVFTQNRVCGAPVTVSRSRLPRADARAVIVNSGNANACTGPSGREHALAMTAAVACCLECDDEQVLVCSTGVIGVPLPIDTILRGIPAGNAALSQDAVRDAATAMMTTDTVPKLATAEVTTAAGGRMRVTGVAKGAAMIAPNMATMLAVVMTDARLTPDLARTVLRQAVDPTFNCISVDGHTSTSDTVLLLANGAAMEPDATDDDVARITEGVTSVCEHLATDIIRDAEGAAHFITVEVSGLRSAEAARRIARAIADSPLVKTAIAGADPNWGRIVSAAGYAGVDFDPACVTLHINETVVFAGGEPTVIDAAFVSEQMRGQREVRLRLSVSGGPESGPQFARCWTSDLTQEYVRLNSEYTT